MKRRNFFAKLAQTAAIVALAPRLAFRAPAERFEAVEQLEIISCWMITKDTVTPLSKEAAAALFHRKVQPVLRYDLREKSSPGPSWSV